jgi:hypothetical protein
MYTVTIFGVIEGERERTARDSVAPIDCSMPRDDFTQPTVQLLAKRVGYRCSNPGCRKPTSGPGGESAVNLGVAAHITAAAPGGARYDPRLTPAERADFENGVWLCQQCGRLVDADEATHDVTTLMEWKAFAEAAAFVELRGFDIVRTRNFADLERKMPELIAEMRADLRQKRFTREFVVLSNNWSYNSGRVPHFSYFFEDHPELLGKLQICVHYRAIYDVKFNDVVRYNFSEDFVDYLLEGAD